MNCNCYYGTTIRIAQRLYGIKLIAVRNTLDSFQTNTTDIVVPFSLTYNPDFPIVHLEKSDVLSTDYGRDM